MTYLPRTKAALKLGVSVRTVTRWEKSSELQFPPPVVVNGRAYFSEQEIDEWAAGRRHMASETPIG